MTTATIDKPEGVIASSSATCSADIFVYPDNCGPASEQLQENMNRIAERETVLGQLRAFIAKHADTLAGMYWRVGYLDPEIELHHGHYRGQKAGPKDIARLWPNATWTRAKEKYGREDEIQWHAVVDGITLKIERAETLAPRPNPKIGGRVKL